MTYVEPAIEVKATEVIADFLSKMSVAARKTYPAWQKLLTDGISDVAPEGSALYCQLIEYQPVEDFYFAGVVALEGAKIQKHLEPKLARKLMAELAVQVDRSSGRPDRAVSDFVWSIISRIQVETGTNVLTMPYDKVVQLLLIRIGLPNHEATQSLMSDFAFRHSLGEPLALGVPDFWKKFAAKIKRQAEAASQFGHISLAAE
jgi:hypothetical protein